MNFIYIAMAANLIAFLQMAIDKRQAEKGKRRISESQLILPTLFGGVLGVVAGMLAFRHKTKKKTFQLKLYFAVVVFIITAYVTVKQM